MKFINQFTEIGKFWESIPSLVQIPSSNAHGHENLLCSVACRCLKGGNGATSVRNSMDSGAQCIIGQKQHLLLVP